MFEPYKETKTMKKLLITTGAAAFAIGAAHAITYTVGAGDTQTATGVTHSERVEKLGDGTLVFTGNNSLSTLTSSAGTVNVHGGTTTISGSGSDGADANAAFVNQGGAFIVDGGGTVNLTGGACGHTDNGVLLVTNGRLAGRSSIPATARACMCTIRRARRSS